MNMANQYQEQDFDYQLDTHRRADKVKESARSRRGSMHVPPGQPCTTAFTAAGTSDSAGNQ